MAEINLLKNELNTGGPLSMGPKGLASLYIAAGVLVLELLTFGGLALYQQHIEALGADLEKHRQSGNLFSADPHQNDGGRSSAAGAAPAFPEIFYRPVRLGRGGALCREPSPDQWNYSVWRCPECRAASSDRLIADLERGT